jgi:drug/metabolite transporter (DMT)-like permease
MVVATILFSGASAASKWLVGIYPVGEVLCLRSFASLIAGGAMILPVSGLSAFVTHRPLDHLARGLSQSISQLCLLLAFSLMPLAGAVAINFSAPLFAALVSIIWLKEPAGFVRGGALVIGFVGVLIVTNPGTNSLTLGALFALTNAVMYGTVTVAVRGMTRTESANTLVMWQLAVLALGLDVRLFHLGGHSFGKSAGRLRHRRDDRLVFALEGSAATTPACDALIRKGMALRQNGKLRRQKQLARNDEGVSCGTS